MGRTGRDPKLSNLLALKRHELCESWKQRTPERQKAGGREERYFKSDKTHARYHPYR